MGGGTTSTMGYVRDQQSGCAERARPLSKDGSDYPQKLLASLESDAPDLWVRGDTAIMERSTVGLLASRKCPGTPIVQAMDLARALRDVGIVVASGFHSPLERDCFEFLIRGDQGVIWCPARTINPYRIPKDRQQAVDDGRLLLVSPFDNTHRRQTAVLARKRNEFVAALADVLIIAYADPGGSLEALAAKALDWGKPVLTLDVPDTENLVKVGAEALSIDKIVSRCKDRCASGSTISDNSRGTNHGPE